MSDEADPYARVEREMVYLVRRAQSRGRELARDVHPELDVAAYVLLRRVDEAEGGLRAADLAVQLAVDKSVVSRQVQHLERLGLLRRDDDPDDARAQRIVLTEEGRGRLGTVLQARHLRFRAMLSSWEPQDVSRFADDLARWNSAY